MENHTSRRSFLVTAAAFAGLLAAGHAFKKNKPLKLSFSTLGCPDWPFEKILDFAAANGYSALELRGILKEMDLTKCPQFESATAIRTTLAAMKDRHLSFIDLGSSAEMHHLEPDQIAKSRDEVRRFIDLAATINCPFVRVFPNKLPKENRDATIDAIIAHLREAADHARGTGVTVLMETHGEVVESALIRHIMDSANHPQLGLVWDVANMWVVTRESPQQVYEQLKPYIRHTHIKDAKIIDNVPHYELLGRGDVPIFEAIDILRKNNYPGYYSFEWEKLWHPEIAEPEIALADYPQAMRKHVAGSAESSDR